jgi:RNA polymerase sigma factor (sigma-70 family)
MIKDKIKFEEDFVDFADFVFNLKQKDEKSWKIFTQVIKRPLTNWIIKNGILDTEQIKTIAADSISTLLLNIDKYDFETYEKLRNCILTIALNKIREFFRTEKKVEFVNLSQIEQNSIYLTVNHNIPKENIQAIVLYLMKFCNNVEKDILIMHYYNALSLKEIAKNLNISEENCRVTKFRILSLLRNKMNYLMKNGIIDLDE